MIEFALVELGFISDLAIRLCDAITDRGFVEIRWALRLRTRAFCSLRLLLNLPIELVSFRGDVLVEVGKKFGVERFEADETFLGTGEAD